MSLAKKMLIKQNYRGIVLNAPDGFSLSTDELPDGVQVTHELSGAFDFALVFAKDRAQLREWFPQVLPHLQTDAKLWVAYPKKSSKLKSDISRDEGWETAKEAGYQGVSLISIDETWSAFRLRKDS
ncbi:hypothetical protein [Alicyclobacillus fastidiosus]|uniref:DUF3052 domain-containing protein n=1 Tax=Alicyclobacillus fastidiosus TaxID=392011 RepID=A0ABV5ADP3_9BACL|nr:hypothetical protein [Alicyclobacillus fastidiosus]WEH08798.1 hypothetical protein PYS47_19215 [Alicyclobacillus fastidiosus]